MKYFAFFLSLITAIPSFSQQNLNGFYWENPMQAGTFVSLGFSPSGGDKNNNGKYASDLAEILSRLSINARVNALTKIHQELSDDEKASIDNITIILKITSEVDIFHSQDNVTRSFPDGTQFIVRTFRPESDSVISKSNVELRFFVEEINMPDIQDTRLHLSLRNSDLWLSRALLSNGVWDFFPYRNQSSKQSKKTTIKDPITPNWILNPTRDDFEYLRANVSIPFTLTGTHAAQLPDALIEGYARLMYDLVSKINIKKEALLKTFVEETGDTVQTSSDILSFNKYGVNVTVAKIPVDETLLHFQISKLYIHYEDNNGTLFLEGVLPVGEAKASINSSLQKDKEFYAKWKQSKAYQQLTEDLKEN